MYVNKDNVKTCISLLLPISKTLLASVLNQSPLIHRLKFLMTWVVVCLRTRGRASIAHYLHMDKPVPENLTPWSGTMQIKVSV